MWEGTSGVKFRLQACQHWKKSPLQRGQSASWSRWWWCCPLRRQVQIHFWYFLRWNKVASLEDGLPWKYHWPTHRSTNIIAASKYKRGQPPSKKSQYQLLWLIWYTRVNDLLGKPRNKKTVKKNIVPFQRPPPPKRVKRGHLLSEKERKSQKLRFRNKRAYV